MNVYTCTVWVDIPAKSRQEALEVAEGLLNVVEVQLKNKGYENPEFDAQLLREEDER